MIKELWICPTQDFDIPMTRAFGADWKKNFNHKSSGNLDVWTSTCKKIAPKGITIYRHNPFDKSFTQYRGIGIQSVYCYGKITTATMLGLFMDLYPSMNSKALTNPSLKKQYKPFASTPPISAHCSPNWATYNSGISSYEYCTKCGKKKGEH